MFASGEKYSSLYWISFVLVAVGGINWGLVGIGGFTDMNLNLVNLLLGAWPMLEWIVYILVGLATVSLIYLTIWHCNHTAVVIKK